MSAADRWRILLHQQRSSDLSVAAFCRRAGVSQPSFYAWRRKLQGEVAFAEVKVSGETTAEAAGIELRLPDRRWIVGRPGFDRGTLIELLHVLEMHSSDMARSEAIR